MNLAVHIRSIDHAYEASKLSEHIASLYAIDQDYQALLKTDDLHLYVGDEFCIHRFPQLRLLKAVIRLNADKQWNLTVLTPPLSDLCLTKASAYFDFLHRERPEAEIVANDWGVLCFLKEKYPSFKLSAGRLLNKGFKDPRLPIADKASQTPKEVDPLFNCCSFDSQAFQEKLLELGVFRIERDLLPHQNIAFGKLHEKLQSSVYFPYGYITTGRICWMSSKFLLSDKCAGFCHRGLMKLTHASLSMPLYQNGNTIFYRYKIDQLRKLIVLAEKTGLRLVYQS